jgi:replicative DNA helicase
MSVLDHLDDDGGVARAHDRLVLGGAWLLDRRNDIPAVWGSGDRVLWAADESLFLTGPSGVGKTTLMANAVLAMIGLRANVLDLPVAPRERVLYLAADRPEQIRRSFARMVHEDHRAMLDASLMFWPGPPLHDLAQHHELLVELADAAKADTLIIDSLKDVAIGLASDEVGAGVNRAIQLANAEHVSVAVLHHHRKAQANGSKPKTLDDVYGSTFLTAGAGSVVLVWGTAGDLIVDLEHLKAPVQPVGPLRIEHDAIAGTMTLSRGEVDVLDVLRHRPQGMTAPDLARLVTGKAEPSDNERKKAERKLLALVRDRFAHRTDAVRGGDGGTQPARYYAAAIEEECPE